MLTWILIAAIIVLVTSMVATRRGHSAVPALPSGQSAGLLERTIKEVRAGDVVQHDGKDYLVEGVVQYDEDGHTWRGARMADAGLEKWLLIGLERAGLTIRLLDAVPGFEMTGYPPETVEQAGVAYKLAQKGTATATFQGDLAGLPGASDGASSRCRWWKYQAAGEKCLIVEQWGESYRALVGASVRPDDVELLAAS